MNGQGLNIGSLERMRRDIEIKECYTQQVTDFIEKYDTHNIIFCYNGRGLEELVEGYFEVVKEFDNVSEALKELSPQMGIQIVGLENENRRYRLGYYRNAMNECTLSEAKVVNIKTLQDIV